MKKIKKINVFTNNKKVVWTFLYGCFLLFFNQCDYKDIEVSIEKLPAPDLTYQTQNLNFTDLVGVKEKSISIKQIFKGVQGEKTGYEIKKVIITGKNPKNMKGIENLEEDIPIDSIDRVGQITFITKLSHPKTKDVFLEGCTININKAPAEIFTFDKITKPYVKNGIFSPENIRGRIRGNKKGYTLKKIQNLTPTGLARVGGNKPNFGLYFIKNGRFTADLIMEHEYKKDATITAIFEIEKQDGKKLWFNKIKQNYGVSTYFYTTEILKNIEGEKKNYTLKEIKDINPADMVTVEGTVPNLNLKINKGGNFMATLVLEHPTKKDAVIKDAQFEVTKISHSNTLGFDGLSGTYSASGRFTSTEILNKVTGAKTGYTLKEIISISPNNMAGYRVLRPIYLLIL